MKNLQKGFAIPIVIAVIALLAIGGGGAYIYTKVETPVLEENNVLSNKQQVEKLLIQTLNQPLYNNEGINVQKENDNYLVGQASVGEGGFLVMAAKVNNKWELIYMGNEFADCDKLVEYDFPQDFLPYYCDCSDEFYKQPYSERIRPKYCE